MDGRLERACQLGYTASCGSLGDMRFHGWKRSRAQRRQDAELVERACLANSQDWRALTDQPGAFCHMLYAWHRERELPRDRKAEARFLALACQQGYSLDCPCRDDTDCAKELFCASGRCTAMSGD